MEIVRPKVGIGVCIRKDGKILLGKRLNSHGDSTWSFPGGHLEFGESWEECARRETLEEVGIEISNPTFATATNDIFELEHKHYITLFMVADYVSGDVQVMESDKCEQWQWFTWDDLPSPLFLPIQNIRQTNFHPFI